MWRWFFQSCLDWIAASRLALSNPIAPLPELP
jgi:hypothetical protein